MIPSYLDDEAYSFIEYFAGTASCSRAIRSAGHHVASLDILYWDTKPGKQNAMDILTPSGMGFLWHFLHGMSYSTYSCSILDRTIGASASTNIFFLRVMLWIYGLMSQFMSHASRLDQHLRLALCTILNAEPGEFVVLLGVVCSSWVVVNAGTSRHSICHPLGWRPGLCESRQHHDCSVLSLQRVSMNNHLKYGCVLWLVIHAYSLWIMC